eukprot:TRINITY_DN9989_c0_g1_i1.p1 TRINITY_DN9989_c0_g1~~TRINITY_DN9989_c0_g1_i1.p1  ORF type:complete len:534 (+),score=126.33 TRINITY_DN9989_c0_g1_i1:57-1604(+)
MVVETSSSRNQRVKNVVAGKSNHENPGDLKLKPNPFEIDSLWMLWLLYLGFFLMVIFGNIREFYDKTLTKLGYRHNDMLPPKGYAPLFNLSEYFWLRWAFQRARDCFERPICSVPGGRFQVMERYSDNENASFKYTGKQIDCLNLSSYNYLGFGECSGPVIDMVAQSIKQYGTSTASSQLEAGSIDVIKQLEAQIATFVGKPAAMIFAMGYATNSTTIAALSGGKGTLIISDALNHYSLVCGCRDSGSVIRVFKHNDPDDLEKILRDSIVHGQPRTRRPWKKILIVCEGIYSMEGYICRLPEIIALKKKYKAYLYVDEAHSIGAIGPTGRGVCEHWGVDTNDVDLLMGTFTKSFGSVGGYIAGSEELIAYLRVTSYGSVYATAMSPPCAKQALEALRLIMGEDGTDQGRQRILRLRSNSNMFRKGMEDMGFIVCGDEDSPIVPVMMYSPSLLTAMSRMLLERGIALVIVGFPVTPLLLGRVRFCISANHTEQDLREALKIIGDIGDRLGCRFLEK